MNVAHITARKFTKSRFSLIIFFSFSDDSHQNNFYFITKELI